MQCPFCQSDDTKVLETRKETGNVQRRRQCKKCGRRFATVERINVEYLSVRKHDGRVEPFKREKIIRGIGRAASVFKIPAADVNAFIDRILDELQPAAPGIPISTTDIGNLVLRHLQDATSVTDVARIRFAMVFLGKTSWQGGFQSATDLKFWLEENYPGLEEATISSGPALVLKRPPRDAEGFSIEKLERSVRIAAKGRGSASQVRQLANDIARRVLDDLTGQPIVTSHQIATFVLRMLRATDSIAYLRYAATTKPFRSVEDFWQEVLALLQWPDGQPQQK